MCKLSQMKTVWRQMSIDVEICDVDWLVQEIRNSIANPLELRFYCISQAIYFLYFEQAVTRLCSQSEDFPVAWQWHIEASRQTS